MSHAATLCSEEESCAGERVMSDLELLIAEARTAEHEDVHDALVLLSTRAAARREAAEKSEKHAAILPLCREALDRVRRLNDIEIPTANNRLAEAWAASDAAQIHLSRHLDQKPSLADYPSDQELAAYDACTSELRAEEEAAGAESRAANRERDQLILDLARAQEELSRLQLQERQLRPRETPQPHYNGGQLLAIRG
jgi:hypothetical protein